MTEGEKAAAAAAPVAAGAGTTPATPAVVTDDGANVVAEEPQLAVPPRVDPANAFDVARDIVKELHRSLDHLRVGRDAGVDGETPPACIEAARDVQLQLLALRRAHRATANAAESGRAKELLARRVADAEFAHLETRRYESACSRAAARRCRAMPTPALSALRPCLVGVTEEDTEEDKEESPEAGEITTIVEKHGLAKHIEDEKEERGRLDAKLEALELQKAQELEAFRARENLGKELAARLISVEKALEPVCNLIELKVRPPTATAGVDAETLASLPDSLRLICSKFDILSSFGDESGVSTKVLPAKCSDAAADDAGEPAAKRARTEEAGPVVEITIAAEQGSAKSVALLFSSPRAPLLVVAASGEGIPDTFLEHLWAEDNGQGPLAKVVGDGAVGRPYGWLQILGGVRDEASALGAATLALASLEYGVTASDVARRVRERLAAI